jgi:hypothetical protein
MSTSNFDGSALNSEFSEMIFARSSQLECRVLSAGGVFGLRLKMHNLPKHLSSTKEIVAIKRSGITITVRTERRERAGSKPAQTRTHTKISLKGRGSKPRPDLHLAGNIL